jgi:hypothetical protein
VIQEWAPLLPVLHRPSFLRVYEDYVADPEAGHWHSNKQAVVQLFLIFEIAALSSVVSMLELQSLTLAYVSFSQVSNRGLHLTSLNGVKLFSLPLRQRQLLHSSVTCLHNFTICSELITLILFVIERLA